MAWLGLVAILNMVTGCAAVRSEATAEIDRPVEVAWSAFADESRLGEWLHGSWKPHEIDGRRYGIQWVDGAEGIVGESREVVFGEPGGETVLVQTITAVRPNELFAFELEHDMMRFVSEIRFEAIDDEHSTVRWSSTIHPRGLVSGIWTQMIRGSIHRRFDEHVFKLKAMIEDDPDATD